MGDYAPLGYSIAFILFVGLIFPFVLGFFMTPEEIELSPFADNLLDIFENGFELDVIPFTDFGTFSINPFSWLGDSLQAQISDSLTYLGLLPDFLVIFIIIMLIFSIVFGLVKLLPTT